MGLGKCVLPMLDWSVACEMILLQNDESLLLRTLLFNYDTVVSDLFWVSLLCHRDFIFFPNVVDSKLFLYKLGVFGSWPRVGLVSFSWVFLIDLPCSWRCPRGHFSASKLARATSMKYHAVILSTRYLDRLATNFQKPMSICHHFAGSVA